MLMAATRLKQIRADLGITQEDVIRKSTSLTLRTYSRAEQGESVRYGTALQILEAINAALLDAGKAPLALNELGLVIS